MTGDDTQRISFELFTSAFCGACAQTRAVLTRAAAVIPGACVAEHDVAFEPELAEERGIEATPTVVVHDSTGVEVFRASGVPSFAQVVAAAGRAVP